MSEKTDSSEDANNDLLPKDNSVKFNSEPDWFLQFIIKQTNNFSLEVGLTLYVNGLVITGIAISGKRYFEEFAEQYKSGFQEDMKNFGELFEEQIKKNTELYPQFWSQVDLDNPDKEIKAISSNQVNYIHLRNVKTLFSRQNSVTHGESALWRGRIESIDGFMLGVMNF